MTGEVVTFTVQWPLVIQALVSVVLPVLVGLVTTRATHPGVKAGLLTLLTCVSTGLTELLGSFDGAAAFDVGVWLLATVTSLVTSIAVHYGIWRPTGVTKAAQGSLVTSRDPEPVDPH